MTTEQQLKELNQKVSQLISLVGIQKDWFNTNELAYYLGYSKESIHKMVKSGEFVQGVHYHKKRKRLLFDKKQIDFWVRSDVNDFQSINNETYNSDCVVEDILSSIAS